MRPVIELLRARGHEVEVTARDFAQTLAAVRALRHRADGRRPPPRRPGGRQGARPRLAVGRARALGARAALRPRDRPRLQRRHRSPPRCCGSRPRPRSTTSGRPSSTTSTAASRARSWSRRRSRPSGCAATAPARASSQRYPGLKEEYYLADFEPDEAVLAELGLDRGRPLAVVRTPPVGVALPPLRERPLRAGAPAPARDRRPGGRAAAHARAARRAGRRAAASSSPSARSTPSRWSPTPTSSSRPAAR